MPENTTLPKPKSFPGWEDAEKAVYEILVERACHKQILFYDEFVQILEGEQVFDSKRNSIENIRKLIPILDKISRATFFDEAKQFLLSVIVINQKDQLPGEGFFSLAKELNLMNGSSNNDFYTEHKEKVFNYFSQSNNTNNNLT